MKSSQPLQKVVFLDRDGVINRDSAQYIKTWEEFDFLPNSLEALHILTSTGHPIILITNQSAINRGLTTMAHLQEIHRQMSRVIEEAGGRILDIFFCPHKPSENCACRKPKPGMIQQAREKHNIDLAASIFIGDSEKDILCARAAGCGQSILVLTGNGPSSMQQLEKKGIGPDYLAKDLLEATRWILDPTRKSG